MERRPHDWLPDALRLPPECWAGGAALPRSRELTPLYIERHPGPWGRALPTRHDHWEWIHVWRGTAVLDVEGRRRVLPCGATALMPPGRVHHETPGRHGMELLWVGLDGAVPADPDADAFGVTEPGDERPLWKELWRVRALQAPGSGQELDALVRLLWTRLRARSVAWRADGMERAAEYLERHCFAREPVAAVARRFGCSESHFYAVFRRRAGLSPAAFRARARLRACYHILLRGGAPVKEVAALAGYDDPLYFSRAFRREFGVAPSRAAHHPLPVPPRRDAP